MAEFKLGRIKFVWQGDWASSTTYYKDDVVRYGAKTFICTVGHTSDSDFYTDLNISPSRWNQMTDGQDFKGDWTTGTFYKERDVVKYGGILYISNTAHTSAATATLGLEADQSSWDVFLEGIDWKDDWTTETRYKVNDVVSYGGITYICNTAHTSAATVALGLEDDQANWTEWNPGVEFKGEWSASGTRYKKNDVVKYGAGLWIASTAHTSSAAFATDSANWDEFVKGVEYESDWSSVTQYQPGDIVSYGGNQYISKTDNNDSNPTQNASDWDLFTENFKFQSNWDITASYKIGEVVKLNGLTYLALQDSPSTSITVTATSNSNNYFTVADTTGLVANMAIRFTGGTFGGVAQDATYYIAQVVSGIAFTIKDSVSGSPFTPDNGSGSMTAVVAALPPMTNYWERLTDGISWQGEWQDDAEYFIGDAVRYSANTYICIQNHRSEGDDGSTIGPEGGGADNSRPDQDAPGNYWNLLSIGSELDVLITRGDLVYFGGAGPTRLPVGREGQVLVAGENDPVWSTLGEVDHVYYVAPGGTNLPSPVWGKTFEKPWGSIRYAAEQIEKGSLVPNTKYLLEMNRVFIQREVTEYIQYQIANADPGSIWEDFEYEDYACERDVGYFVDALIFDLSHGGNVKTRGVANSLVGAITEDSPGAYPGLAVEKEQSIAAYTYALTVITAVLNQVAPDTNYQVLNGDNSTAVVEQFFDSTITAETEYGSGSSGTGYLGGYSSTGSTGSGSGGGY